MHDMADPTGIERGLLNEQRVRAAVDEIVAATDPEQVVLFGSFARDSARPDSDIDLLVIGDPARHADGKRTCASSGDEVDVFVTDRATAERYRYSAAYLEGIALGEGRTVYARNPERALAAGRAMVRRTLYDPDKAQEWADEAADRLQQFETNVKDLYKCQSLADAVENSLKALIVAGGNRVEHRHGLGKLWRQAEKVAGELPATLTEDDLKHLTKYGGEFRYPAAGVRKLDPGAVWQRLETPVRSIVAHSRRRVPDLVEQTKARIAGETG